MLLRQVRIGPAGEFAISPRAEVDQYQDPRRDQERW